MSTPRRKLAVVAREAGVSVSTVSKVLRAYPDVAPATRERVRAVLRRAGYPVERPVRREASVLIDVVVASTGTSWAGEVLAGLAERVRGPGPAVVVTTVTPGCPVPRVWLEQLFARGSRGVIGLDAEFTEVQRAYLAAHQIPCVLVDSGLDDAVSHALAAILDLPAELAG
ncbi:LacI family DNA-binding transcriptional regulator [Kribbella sp. NPDC051586]|uniref:LacI family DNA-binding transcriptional regulator n=1 Tax=Kribbella sp. NPDC051586 TaxID=3364118 RepID=UPI003797F05F